MKCQLFSVLRLLSTPCQNILFRCFLVLNNSLVLFITDPLQDGPELVHGTFTRLERDGHVLS